ncbi:MAG: acyl-CoA dehydrogenase family protein [Myxococcota bacterium]|nr:acyl-CoA dehydrogenase family protein [Myxococcota bacterium]
MDFSYTDEQNEVRELARKILGDLATNERLKDIEAKQPVFDEQLWRELGRSNLLGLAIPEAYGGSDLGYLDLCLMLQEIGRAVAPVPLFATCVLGALPIAHFGSEAQKREWLPKVASGEAILSGALVELGAASVQDISTEAVSDGNRFKLSGEKTLVPAASLADRIVVPARSGNGIGLFLLDPKTTGVQLEDQATCDRQPYSHLDLDGASAEAIGDADSDATSLQWLADRATIGLCAVQLGVGERALEMTAEYARERFQFDRPIGSFQAVHQRAGDAFINMEAIRLTLLEAALFLAQGREGPAIANAIQVAKYWASEGGQFTAYACQHLHGGIGIDVDYPRHRYFIWSTQIEHSLGCARDQLQRLGASIAERGIISAA